MKEEKFKEKLKKIIGNNYSLVNKYIDKDTYITLRHNCLRCNNAEFEIKPKNIKSTIKCPECEKIKKNEEFKQEVYDLVGDEYEVVGEYINDDTHIKMRHNSKNCKYYKKTGKYFEYDVKPSNFKIGRRCPKCFGKNKLTTEEFKQEVYDLVGDEYEVVGEYINDDTHIKMRHNSKNCKYYKKTGKYFEYDVKPSNFKIGRRCPKCFGKNKLTTEEFKQEVYDLVGDEYEVVGEYIGTNDHIMMKHNSEKCNYNVYPVSPNNFLYGGCRCNYCSKCNNKSKGEKELCEYIKTLSKNIKENDRTLIYPFELDILNLDNNIAFEYDGLYWHSEQMGCSKNYHLDKTNKCKEKNIRLIHIFEDEWLNKKDIVKSKIKYLIYKNNNPKIYARKCYIKEISSKEKNKFLNNNHIQGEDKANIKLGLFTKKDNKLVSVMTFCKPRKSLGHNNNSKYDYELSRFASDINYIVIGAFSKLLKYFKNNYKWKKLITYADKRWSEGNVYIKNGWTYLHDSKPNYWYTDGKEKYHRYNFRKQELKKLFPKLYNENLTEFEIMDKTEYKRIWDCGNMVFEYIK